MSSLPNFSWINSARRAASVGSLTSSRWNCTSGSPDPWSISTSDPFFSFLAVRITMTPLEASCLHTSSPIPWNCSFRWQQQPWKQIDTKLRCEYRFVTRTHEQKSNLVGCLLSEGSGQALLSISNIYQTFCTGARLAGRPMAKD